MHNLKTLEQLENDLIEVQNEADALKNSKYGATNYPMAKIRLESLKKEIEALKNKPKGDSK